MIITYWRRQLLIQQIENVLNASGRSLIAGKNVKLNKLSIPQLQEVLTWISKYPTMDSWLLDTKEMSWSEHAESAINKLGKNTEC